MKKEILKALRELIVNSLVTLGLVAMTFTALLIYGFTAPSEKKVEPASDTVSSIVIEYRTSSGRYGWAKSDEVAKHRSELIPTGRFITNWNDLGTDEWCHVLSRVQADVIWN